MQLIHRQVHIFIKTKTYRKHPGLKWQLSHDQYDASSQSYRLLCSLNDVVVSIALSLLAHFPTEMSFFNVNPNGTKRMVIGVRAINKLEIKEQVAIINTTRSLY